MKTITTKVRDIAFYILCPIIVPLVITFMLIGFIWSYMRGGFIVGSDPNAR